MHAKRKEVDLQSAHSFELVAEARRLENIVYKAIKRGDRDAELFGRHKLRIALGRIYSEPDYVVRNFFHNEYWNRSSLQSAIYGIAKSEIASVELKINCIYPIDCTPIASLLQLPLNTAIVLPSTMSHDEEERAITAARVLVCRFAESNSAILKEAGLLRK